MATNTETTIQEMLGKLLLILEEMGISGLKIDYATPRVGDVKHLLGWQVGLE